MLEFYLVINHERLYVYRHGPGRFEAEFFEGEPSFPYETNRVKEEVDKLEKELLNNNNIEDNTTLSFIVLLTDDQLLNTAFRKALEGKISRIIEIDGLLRKVMERLARDAGNYVDEFGINYDGRCYRRHNNELESAKFNLLAYTLTPNNMLEEF